MSLRGYLFIFFFAVLSKIQAQPSQAYDSLFRILFVDPVPADTNRVRALYSLSELTLCDNDPVKSSEIEKYFNEALNISLGLSYADGFNFYFEHLDWFYDKITLPLIRTKIYPEYISKHNVRPLYEARNKLFNISFYTYFNLLNKAKISTMPDKHYVFWFFTGLAYIDQGNFRHACNHLHMAITGAQRDNDLRILADAHAVMGYVKYNLLQTDSAGIYFDRALAVPSLPESKKVVCLNNAGEVKLTNGDFNKAIDLFKQARCISSNIKDTAGLGWSLHNEGRALTRLHSFQNSESCFSKSLKLASQIKNNELIIRNLYCLSEVSHELGKNSAAMDYFSRFMQTKDSLMAEELDRLLKTRENQWQTEIGREITRKETEAWQRRYTTLELNKSKTFIIALIAILLIMVLMVVMLYRMYRFKKQAAGYLNELNKSRDRLYAIVSHDLRSPLISLISSMEYLKESGELLPAKEIKGHIGKMLELTDKTRFLLDNLLMWLKDQKGLIGYNPQSIEIAEIVAFNAELFKPLAESKKITIHREVQNNLNVYTDRNMLDLIIRNLLSNALKFTGPEGKVFIRAFSNNGHVIIKVADTGKGMEETDLKKLLDPAIAGKKSNSGLGLILVRDFLVKMAGTMNVESKGLGEGTCFTIQLNSDTNRLKGHDKN